VSALLEVVGLSVGFRTRRGVVQALTDTTVSLERGELLLVVGESGSGKTVLAHSLLALLPRNVTITGAIRLGGENLLAYSERRLRSVRGRRLALIPQTPASALSPVRRIGSQLAEGAMARGLTREEAQRQLAERLGELDLDLEELSDRYVHQLSGGMQQRVVNALALVGQPEIVIADEPTSGLDSDLVDATAAQLLAISARGAALLVITHDLRLAERLGGRLALLYASRIVEQGPTADFFAAPSHPYGRELLRALPEREGKSIPGLSPELTELPAHCAFAPRCPHRFDPCEDSIPDLYPVSETRRARCFLHAER
jgi:peptide/nickel transport system ATP-binding protein